jgi:sensor histidine kinase regulating citrate/malate metabolism
LELRIEVRDTGVGIRPNALSAIFRAFQRVDESRPDGLGLGLFIVKHAADLLGHRVEVRSTEGRGSCFTVVADAAALSRERSSSGSPVRAGSPIAVRPRPSPIAGGLAPKFGWEGAGRGGTD